MTPELRHLEAGHPLHLTSALPGMGAPGQPHLHSQHIQGQAPLCPLPSSVKGADAPSDLGGGPSQCAPHAQ